MQLHNLEYRNKFMKRRKKKKRPMHSTTVSMPVFLSYQKSRKNNCLRYSYARLPRVKSALTNHRRMSTNGKKRKQKATYLTNLVWSSKWSHLFMITRGGPPQGQSSTNPRQKSHRIILYVGVVFSLTWVCLTDIYTSLYNLEKYIYLISLNHLDCPWHIYTQLTDVIKC